VFTLRLELQQPGITVAHQVVAALLVGLLAAVLARALMVRHRVVLPGSSLSGEWANG